MKLHNVTEECFRKYGRIVKDIDFTQLTAKLKQTDIPEGVVYEPSIEEFEKLAVAKQLSQVFYGEMPIQIGYCNGHNVLLNAVEYHRSSEINLAATDAVLILGIQADVTEDYTYETAKMEAFLLPEGVAVELFATTLHYAPCHVKETGFQVAVILPAGTNYPLEQKHSDGEDALITAKNKWLIGHAQGGLAEDCHIGLIGKNLNINE